MKIAIGSDHAGFSLKESLKNYLTAEGYEVADMGTNDTQSCHYPLFAGAVCDEVISGRAERGILVCGTGIGMSMAANKIKGIRAAAVSDCFTAEATRMHNDANVICLGERTLGPGLANKIAKAFIDTPFEGGRHQTRVDMIMALENK